MAAAGQSTAGPGIATYEDSAAGDDTIVVHAGMAVAGDTAGQGFAIVDLAAIEMAATIVHRGSVHTVVSTEQLLARSIAAHGYRSTG